MRDRQGITSLTTNTRNSHLNVLNQYYEPILSHYFSHLQVLHLHCITSFNDSRNLYEGNGRKTPVISDPSDDTPSMDKGLLRETFVKHHNAYLQLVIKATSNLTVQKRSEMHILEPVFALSLLQCCSSTVGRYNVAVSYVNFSF